MIEKDVFHIRLNNIEIQAERLIDSCLRTRPIAIISSSHQNGSIVCLSDEAKYEGLVLGMKVSVARKISNRTQLLPYNYSLYERIHYHAYRSISSYTPIVEPEGISEFFLDMNGMQSIINDIQDTGIAIINCIRDKIGISGIVGISTNKLVSRIITSVISDSIHKVDSGSEAQFLSSLSPLVLPIVKEKHVSRILKFLLIDHIGQIQSMTSQPDHFRIFFGNYAPILDNESRGYDSSIVRPLKRKDHILEQVVLKRDTNDIGLLHGMVRYLSDKIAFQLRKRRQLANKVRLEIHYTDGYRMQRMGSLKRTDDVSVMDVCQSLFDGANKRRNCIRVILIDIWEFRPCINQVDLFSIKDKRMMLLSNAVDEIRQKYGIDSLQNFNVLQALNM